MLCSVLVRGVLLQWRSGPLLRQMSCLLLATEDMLPVVKARFLATSSKTCRIDICYVYCFMVASLILLVAMIGAILLTMRKRMNVRKQEIFDQVYGNINSNVRYIN